MFASRITESAATSHKHKLQFAILYGVQASSLMQLCRISLSLFRSRVQCNESAPEGQAQIDSDTE